MVFFPVLAPAAGGAEALVTDRRLPAASTEMIVNATTAEMTKDAKVSAKVRAGRVKVFMVIGVSSDGDFSNTLEERRGLANLHSKSARNLAQQGCAFKPSAHADGTDFSAGLCQKPDREGGQVGTHAAGVQQSRAI
jgi:hypothetical protein